MPHHRPPSPEPEPTGRLATPQPRAITPTPARLDRIAVVLADRLRGAVDTWGWGLRGDRVWEPG